MGYVMSQCSNRCLIKAKEILDKIVLIFRIRGYGLKEDTLYDVGELVKEYKNFVENEDKNGGTNAI